MVARSENELASHRRHLGRGFNWLGGATTVAKITDFSTIIVVLLFLTKTRLGIGSLVLSIGMVVEAFDGLGTGDALVQAPSIDTRQLRRLFWFILAAAIAVAGHCRCPPLFGWIYGMAGLPVDFLAVAAKQPLVGAAVIPLALLNRELRYERIALINVGATFGAALVRLGLALGGGGVWCCLPPFLEPVLALLFMGVLVEGGRAVRLGAGAAAAHRAGADSDSPRLCRVVLARQGGVSAIGRGHGARAGRTNRLGQRP